MEEEQEEEESEPQIADYEEYDWDEDDQALYGQFVLRRASVFGS
jgi:hypothetical protein